MIDTRAELREALAATPTILRALLRDLPDEMVRVGGEGADAWSIAEVVCHLRDVEQRILDRVRQIRDEDRPWLSAFDQEAQAEAARYRDQSLTGALQTFVHLRAEQLAQLESLQPSEWERIGVHEEAGEITIEQLIAHIAVHDSVHLAQIARRILLQTGTGLDPLRAR